MKRTILNIVFCLLILVSYGQISSISNGETGSSVRSKLNAVIDSINNNEIMTLVRTNGNFIVGNGSNWQVESGSAARASLGLTLGSDVQAYDADLAIYAGITPSANIQTFLQSANFLAARNNLELGVSDEVEFNKLTIDTLTNEAGAGKLVWGDIAMQQSYIYHRTDDVVPPTLSYIEITTSSLDFWGTIGGFINLAAGDIDITAASGEVDLSATEYIDVAADSLDMGNKKVTNLATSVNPKDATNKEYVDGLIDDLSGVSDAAAARTNLVIPSGTYSPTLSGYINTASATLEENGKYVRSGDIVKGSFTIRLDPTAGSTLTRVKATLPVASSFDSAYDVQGAIGIRDSGGTLSAATNYWGGYTEGVTSDNTFYIYFVSENTSTHTVNVLFTYEIE